jgi:hypothetical protein
MWLHGSARSTIDSFGLFALGQCEASADAPGRAIHAEARRESAGVVNACAIII